MRVLIVEDDERYREYLRALVARLGCVAVAASDGAEALIRLGESAFDLLLSDLAMPKLNGLDLITHVRAHPTASSIYAVMITANDDAQSKIDALTRGYDDFLPKSSTEVEVAARIGAAGRLLARQRATDAELLRWRDLATRDELTNAATRRAFLDRARQHVADGNPISVVLLDLDDFKQINDSAGHLAGDRVLRDVGALFLSRTRREDVMARYGGDEFILLVVDASVDEAQSIADRLLEDVAQLRWLVGTDTLRISATAGIAHSRLLAEPTVDRLIDAADRDLYAKKWLKKHPPAASDEVYEYPTTSETGTVVPMPEPDTVIRPMAASDRDEA